MIEGQTINFRPLEENDLEQLKHWRNSPQVRRTTREYRLLSMVNQKRWFENLHSHNPPTDLMFGIVSKDNKLLGVCGLTYINWKNKNAEVSLYIGDSNWQGKGIAKESMTMLIDFGFMEAGFHRIWAEIYEFNEASVRLCEGIGFKREGVCREVLWREGSWHNSILYSILQNEYNRTNIQDKK